MVNFIVSQAALSLFIKGCHGPLVGQIKSELHLLLSLRLSRLFVSASTTSRSGTSATSQATVCQQSVPALGKDSKAAAMFLWTISSNLFFSSMVLRTVIRKISYNKNFSPLSQSFFCLTSCASERCTMELYVSSQCLTCLG